MTEIFPYVECKSEKDNKNVFINGEDDGIVKNGKLYYQDTDLKSNLDLSGYEDFSKVKILFIRDGVACIESIINADLLSKELKKKWR